MASTSGDKRKKEATISLQNEGPIASRLRSHSKEASQIAPTGGSNANNSSDKPSQPSRQNQHAKSKPSTEKKTVLSSSSCRTGQPSMDQSTKKSNDSVSKKSVQISSPCRTTQPSKDKGAAKNSSDSTPKRSEILVSSSCRTNQSSKDHGVKNSKVSTPKCEIHVTSCRTSQHSQDIQGTQNNKDSTSKRSVTHISSSRRTSQPSKDRATKRTKSETQRKDLVSLLAKSKDSAPKSGLNSSVSKPNHHLQYQETKISMSSAPNKSDISKPSPSNVGKEQENTITSVKFPQQLLVETPIYHIRWTGFDTSMIQPAGWNCELCEKDLSYSPEEEDELELSLHSEDDDLDDSYYSEEELEYFMPPEVTVLPCNHVYHSMCLQLAAVGEKLTDPSCPICLR